MSGQKSSRRNVLRSVGCTLSLPMLSSMPCMPFLRSVGAGETQPTGKDSSGRNGQASGDASRLPKRFCCIFFPNGVSLPPKDHPAHQQWHWFPHETGDGYSFTQTLKPLRGHRDELTILSGLSHPAMRSSIAHITADSFLTGADSSRVYKNSISLDQVIANRIGSQTRFASLALSSDGGIGAPGRAKTLSFSASGRPIPSLSNPRMIFARLFGVEKQSVEEQRRAFGRDRSILDNVLEETAILKRHLSTGDRRRLEEYTNSVREIEKRLESADRWLDAQVPAIDASEFELDVSPRDDAEDYIRAILDLIYLAFATDSTRSITYQITSEDAKGIGDHFPKSLGLAGHHALSHGTGKERGYKDWATYDRFLARQLAYLLDRLAKTDDPTQQGSLLDNTIVLYGCSTSKTHRAENYPLVLAGGREMGLQHGQHRRFDQDQFRLSDLFVTLLQHLEIDEDRFADSTRSMNGLV